MKFVLLLSLVGSIQLTLAATLNNVWKSVNISNPSEMSRPQDIRTLSAEWNFNTNDVMPNDKFFLSMPYVFRTKFGGSIDLTVDGVTYASCTSTDGSYSSIDSYLTCVISSEVSSYRNIFVSGTLSFDFVFNAGGSTSQSDLQAANYIRSGDNQINFNGFQNTINFDSGPFFKDSTKNGLVYYSRSTPENYEQVYVLSGDCNDGISSGSLVLTSNNTIDCNKFGIKMSNSFNDFYFPKSDSATSCGNISCSSNSTQLTATFKNVPAGYRVFLEGLDKYADGNTWVKHLYAQNLQCGDSSNQVSGLTKIISVVDGSASVVGVTSTASDTSTSTEIVRTDETTIVTMPCHKCSEESSSTSIISSQFTSTGQNIPSSSGSKAVLSSLSNEQSFTSSSDQPTTTTTVIQGSTTIVTIPCHKCSKSTGMSYSNTVPSSSSVVASGSSSVITSHSSETTSSSSGITSSSSVITSSSSAITSSSSETTSSSSAITSSSSAITSSSSAITSSSSAITSSSSAITSSSSGTTSSSSGTTSSSSAITSSSSAITSSSSAITSSSSEITSSSSEITSSSSEITSSSTTSTSMERSSSTDSSSSATMSPSTFFTTYISSSSSQYSSGLSAKSIPSTEASPTASSSYPSLNYDCISSSIGSNLSGQIPYCSYVSSEATSTTGTTSTSNDIVPSITSSIPVVQSSSVESTWVSSCNNTVSTTYITESTISTDFTTTVITSTVTTCEIKPSSETPSSKIQSSFVTECSSCTEPSETPEKPSTFIEDNTSSATVGTSYTSEVASTAILGTSTSEQPRQWASNYVSTYEASSRKLILPPVFALLLSFIYI